MTYTDFYLSAPDEATALEAAQVEGFDLVVDGRWNTSPGNGRSAFAVTRGPVVGMVPDEDGNESPVYADGFYALLRVPSDMAQEIGALLADRANVLDITEAPARFTP